ncbi:TPA: hypothetical protein MDM57_003483 [Klebsiella pneumoniae]|nr:hypothetical protein [Klebsiella pneumoniae]
MTSKLTRERIELIANFHRAMTLPPSHDEIEELARMALAAMDSEPVQWRWRWSDDAEGYWRYTEEQRETRGSVTAQPLYRHAQQPVVLADIALPHSWFDGEGVEVMSADEVKRACRAAMLQAQPVCTCPSGDGSLRWPCPVHPGNSPVIPEGYVMVPKEPTEAMMLHNSGCQHHAWDDPDCAMRQTRRLIWSHMLAAAPQEVK